MFLSPNRKPTTPCQISDPGDHWSADPPRTRLPNYRNDVGTPDAPAVRQKPRIEDQLTSHKQLRTRRGAGQPFLEQCQHQWWPRFGMVVTRSAGRPEGFRFFCPGEPISGGQRVEPARREVELVGGGGGRQGAFTKTCEPMTDEGGRVTLAELLMFFKGQQDTPSSHPCRQSFRRPSLRSASSKTGGRDEARHREPTLSCFANYTTPPVLLAPRQEKAPCICAEALTINHQTWRCEMNFPALMHPPPGDRRSIEKRLPNYFFKLYVWQTLTKL